MLGSHRGTHAAVGAASWGLVLGAAIVRFFPAIAARAPRWAVAVGGALGLLLPGLVQWRVGPLTALSKLLLRRVRIEHAPNPSPRKQRGQRPAAFPPPYPNGWFRVMGSWELAPKAVRALRVLGEDLVLYRTEAGAPVVMHGYCPHLGAHLGVGGTVHGDCIRCPFHGWEFDPTGHCVAVAGCPSPDATKAANRVNPAYGARIPRWVVAEWFDAIFIWHDSEGREPTWWPNDPECPPPPPQLTPSSCRSHGEVLAYFARDQYYLAGSTHAVVNTHIQEIPENGADVAHLGVLHEDFVVQHLRWLLLHKWTAEWQSAFTASSTAAGVDTAATGDGVSGYLSPCQATEDGAAAAPPPRSTLHYTSIYLTQEMALRLGRVPVPGTLVKTYINQIGPGIVRLRIVISGRFELLVTEFITPFAPTQLHAVHTVHARHGTPRLLAQLVLWSLDAQFQRDVPIWEGKKFEPRPVLSPVDGPIASFRRWYGQFYGPASTSFAEAVQREVMLDDW